MKSPTVVSLVAGVVIGLGMLGNPRVSRPLQSPVVIALIEQRDHSVMPEALVRSIISEVSNYSLDDGTDFADDAAEDERESAPGKSASPHGGVGLANGDQGKSDGYLRH